MASYVEILVTMILKSHKVLMAVTSYGLWCPVLISKQGPLMQFLQPAASL